MDHHKLDETVWQDLVQRLNDPEQLKAQMESKLDRLSQPLYPDVLVPTQHAVPLRTLPALRVHHGHGGDMDDVLDVVAGLQHMHWRPQPEQDRTDGLRTAQAG